MQIIFITHYFSMHYISYKDLSLLNPPQNAAACLPCYITFRTQDASRSLDSSYLAETLHALARLRCYVKCGGIPRSQSSTDAAPKDIFSHYLNQFFYTMIFFNFVYNTVSILIQLKHIINIHKFQDKSSVLN